MKIASASEIQNIDRIAIDEHGIPGFMLMEFAGLLVLKVLFLKFPSSPKKILILCGKGNNGGDGLVVGRHLFRMNVPTNIFLLGKRDSLSGDARLNSEFLYKLSIPVFEITEESQVPILYEFIENSDIIIDAIFGTGLNSPIRGLAAQVISMVNESEKTVISIDIPSGVNATTGQLMGSDAIRADITVTMGLPKLGLLLYPGASRTGEIFVADIGFPENLLQMDNIQCRLATCEEISSWIPFRPQNAHKGSSGKIVVIAGSKGYTGAAALTCESALRTGAGLVTLAIQESLNAIIEEKLTETITHPYPDMKKDSDIEKVLKTILPLLKKADAVAIGPGIGRSSRTQKLMMALMTHINIPSVIDADALFPKILKGHKMPMPILTPHPGEMARLMDKKVEDILSSPLEYCRACAKKYRACVILKGSHSIISCFNGESIINPTGNPGMATAGMGDVLTGVISGLLAQGVQYEKAAILGVFIHGIAGDFASEQFGERGILASDLIPNIPLIINLLSRNKFEEIQRFIPIRKVTIYK